MKRLPRGSRAERHRVRLVQSEPIEHGVRGGAAESRNAPRRIRTRRVSRFRPVETQALRRRVDARRRGERRVRARGARGVRFALRRVFPDRLQRPKVAQELGNRLLLFIRHVQKFRRRLGRALHLRQPRGGTGDHTQPVEPATVAEAAPSLQARGVARLVRVRGGEVSRGGGAPRRQRRRFAGDRDAHVQDLQSARRRGGGNLRRAFLRPRGGDAAATAATLARCASLLAAALVHREAQTRDPAVLPLRRSASGLLLFGKGCDSQESRRFHVSFDIIMCRRCPILHRATRPSAYALDPRTELAACLSPQTRTHLSRAPPAAPPALQRRLDTRWVSSRKRRSPRRNPVT